MGKKIANAEQLNLKLVRNEVEVESMKSNFANVIDEAKRAIDNKVRNMTRTTEGQQEKLAKLLGDSEKLKKQVDLLVGSSIGEIVERLKADSDFSNQIASAFDKRLEATESQLNVFSNAIKIGDSNSVKINGSLLVYNPINKNSYVAITAMEEVSRIELFGKDKASGIVLHADPKEANVRLLAAAPNEEKHVSRISLTTFSSASDPDRISFHNSNRKERLRISSRETGLIRFWDTNGKTRIKIRLDSDPVQNTAKFELESQEESTIWYRGVQPDGTLLTHGE